MIDGKTILAIVPARGGSKRLHRKNVLSLAGKPLILWSIEAGSKSKYIDKLVVTSDDKEILGVSEISGVQQIVRPKELASDESSSFSVVQHVIETIDETFDFIVLLQPTSPLRNEIHIDKALELLAQKEADAVISVSKMEHSPLWANILPSDKSMSGFIKEDIKSVRSQDLPEYFRLNGAIFICETVRLMNEKTFMIENNIFAFEMDRNISVDIDVKEDLLIAEMFLAANE
jgi:CMP-N,N'-diacetyllegionaminic acid synthase